MREIDEFLHFLLDHESDERISFSKKMKYGLIALGVVLFIALLILSVVISNLGISKGHTH